MASFFTMAFALSWLAWTPLVLSNSGLGVIDFDFPTLLGSTQLLGVLPGAYLGPIFSAFLVTALADGRAGLRIWTARVLRWRVGWRWYVATLLAVPATILATTAPFAPEWRLPSLAAVAAYVFGLAFQMVTTGLAEEPGWRDFALPRLQPVHGPVRGSVVLGVMWGIWHLPLFLTEWGDYPHSPWYVPVEFCVMTIMVSLVMTWVFNRSGESLPVAIVLHASINNTFSTVWSEIFPGLGYEWGQHIILLASTIVALALLVATRGRLAYRPPHAVRTGAPAPAR
jgi:membrane protease YdiL (CAAX protease family)